MSRLRSPSMSRLVLEIPIIYCIKSKIKVPDLYMELLGTVLLHPTYHSDLRPPPFSVCNPPPPLPPVYFKSRGGDLKMNAAEIFSLGPDPTS
jgi:hypothetical protein